MAVETLHITKQNCRNTKGDGTPLINSFGKPYFSVGIRTEEYGDTWINGFSNFEPKWEGTAQELDVYDKEHNGKRYKQFKVPRKALGAIGEADRALLVQLSADVAALREEVGQCKKYIIELGKRLKEAGTIT